MRKPTLVVVNGRPGSGKSTFASHLAENISLPVFSKDEFKELIFDTLGYSDQDWSMKCNSTSYALIMMMAKKCLFCGQSVIIESNFSIRYDSEKINSLITETGAKVIQIICSADKDILFERFKERVLSGKRHPGHNDDKDFSVIKEKHFTAEYEPLDLPGENIVYDTTEFDENIYRSAVEQVKSFIEDDGAEKIETK